MGRLTSKDIVHMLDTMPDRIRIARIKAGMTQEEVAEKVGVSRPAISQYESGTSEISIENLLRLSEALDVSPIYLLGLPSQTISRLPPSAREVIVLMEKLSPEDRAVVLRLVKGFLPKEE